MSDPVDLLGMYLHLARDSARRQRLLFRDKMLLIAGMIAVRMELPSVSAYCRGQILRNNPGHMVRRWPHLEQALEESDFQHLLKQVQRRFPQEKAERLMQQRGIEMGRERETYYTDEEYAASILGTTVEQMRQEQASQ